MKNSYQKPDIPELIPRDILFGNPEKSMVSISPDATHIAYIAPSKEGVNNVWIRGIDMNDDRVITNDTYRGIRFYFWAYNNSQVLYVQDKDGDENFHVHSVDITSNETKDLTPFDSVKVNAIALHHEFPNEIILDLNKRDEKVFDIYRLNLKSGDLTLEIDNPGDVRRWYSDHSFFIRVVEALDPQDGSTIIRVRNNPKDEWRVLITASFGENLEVSGFTEDNKNLLIQTSINGNTVRLVELDFESGKEIREVISDEKSDIMQILKNRITHKLEAICFNYTRARWVFFDKDVESDFALLNKVNTGDIHLGSRDIENKKWIVAFEGDNAPKSYYLYNRETKQATFLYTDTPALEKHQLSKMEPVIIPSRDGLDLVSYLTLPVWMEPKQLPLVLFVHGGPWARDTWGFKPMVQWLSNRGYAVLQVNYRGSAGFGKKFLNAGNGQWGIGYMQHDLTDAVKWIIDQGIVDPARVAIMGGSYGGYAVLAGLTFTPELYACGVDIVGPSQLKTLIETIPPYWEPFKKNFILRIGDVENDEELNKKISPLFHVDNIKVPLLIGQGANDPRVKISESDQIVHAMRSKGLDVEYIVFTDEGHGFVRPENRLEFYGIAEEFLTKHIGGRKEPYNKVKGSTAERR